MSEQHDTQPFGGWRPRAVITAAMRAVVHQTLGALLERRGPRWPASAGTTARVVWWTAHETGIGASTTALYLASVWARAAADRHRVRVMRVGLEGRWRAECRRALRDLAGRTLITPRDDMGDADPRRLTDELWCHTARLQAEVAGLLVMDGADRLSSDAVCELISTAVCAAGPGAGVGIVLIAGPGPRRVVHPGALERRLRTLLAAGTQLADTTICVALGAWSPVDLATVLTAWAPGGAVDWAAPAHAGALAAIHHHTRGVASSVVAVGHALVYELAGSPVLAPAPEPTLDPPLEDAARTGAGTPPATPVPDRSVLEAAVERAIARCVAMHAGRRPSSRRRRRSPRLRDTT